MLLINKNNNLSNKLKLKPITTYYIGFVVKILQKYYKSNTS